MSNLSSESFAKYCRRQWAEHGYWMSEVVEAPYKELVAARDGWSFGCSVARAENPNCKARLGVWFRPAPKGSLADVAALRTHYQTKLAQQRRGSRIINCGLPVGSVFLFFETTGQIEESAVADFVDLCQELAALAFDADGLDELLEAGEG
jgi:hypothetical protein